MRKGCLVLQRRFAYIGHEIAKFLKEDGIVDQFCGYVQVRDGYRFLLSQKDIPYTALILDEDIQKEFAREKLDTAYISAFEREYGSPWRYLNVDRVIRYGQLVREYPHKKSPFTDEEKLRIFQVFAKKIDVFLDDEKPDFVFGYIFGSLGSLLLHDMAKRRGIPILTAIIPSTKDLVTVSERYDRLTFVEKAIIEHRSTPLERIPSYETARAFLEEFRVRPSAYNKVVMSREKQGKWNQFAFLHPQHILWTFYFNFIKTFVDWAMDRERRGDYTTVNPFYRLFDVCKRKVRNLRGVEDLYDRFDRSKKYAFFPLQYEPETSLLLLAPTISDQTELVCTVAEALPDGMLLYVKEHPAMVPYRERNFYRKIKQVENIRLLRPDIKSFDIIQSTRIVTLINGTPGWEATLLKKPVITFGEVFYNALTFIGRGEVNNLPKQISEHLKVEVDDEELIRFLAVLFEDSASLDLMYLWEVETDEERRRLGFKKFADVLGRKIQEVVASERT